VRQQLGFRTLFNLLGPLTNPASAEFQLLGVGRIPLAELMAGALAQLGAQRAIVVCGNGELDEVSLWGPTTVFDVRNGRVERQAWTATTFGLPECRVEELKVDGPIESAAVISHIFAGAAGAPRNMVLANAAAALVAAERVQTPLEGVAQAAAAIDSGCAAGLLATFAEKTRLLAGDPV